MSYYWFQVEPKILFVLNWNLTLKIRRWGQDKKKLVSVQLPFISSTCIYDFANFSEFDHELVYLGQGQICPCSAPLLKVTLFNYVKSFTFWPNGCLS